MKRSLILTSILFVLIACPIFASAQKRTPAPSPDPLQTLPANVLNAELKSVTGDVFKLSDYAGKVLVINFWAPWAVPSRMEIPNLGKLQKRFWSRGLRVVGLTTQDTDTSARDVQDFISFYQIQYKIGWTTTEVDEVLNAKGIIPQTYVVAASGRIVTHFIGYNSRKTPPQVNQAIAKALRETSRRRKP